MRSKDRKSIFELLADYADALVASGVDQRYEALLARWELLALDVNQLPPLQMERELRACLAEVDAECRLRIAQCRNRLYIDKHRDSIRIDHEHATDVVRDAEFRHMMVEVYEKLGKVYLPTESRGNELLRDVRRSLAMLSYEALHARIGALTSIRHIIRKGMLRYWIALHGWWTLWGLVVLTLIVGCLSGYFAWYWGLAISAIAWVVQYSFLNRLLDNAFLRWRRRQLKRLAAFWADASARLLFQELSEWIAVEAGKRASQDLGSNSDAGPEENPHEGMATNSTEPPELLGSVPA
ncbi:MAG: hypothetical protein IT431_11885 [Phycisphaerales bacterium]|nr:hypothetical protein [Phycisphaerales bacterium]